VFAEANVQAGRDSYRLRVIATAPGDIRSSSGGLALPARVLRPKSVPKLGFSITQTSVDRQP